jgi:glucuronoarabinoxylan endo-1,4-beta-xylanase
MLAVLASMSAVACSESSAGPSADTDSGAPVVDSSAPGDGSVMVTWSDLKQSVDGFGASAVFFGGSITEDLADLLFDAKKGIGLSMVRIQIGLPNDIQSDGSELTGANPVATAPELATARQAIARGCKVWAAAWTPPPIWKTTNNKNGSGTGFTSNKLLPSHYQDYANYLAGFMRLTAASNVPIFGLSPANEPDYVATWDNAQWAPDELTKFIVQNLGPTFAQSWPTVKIIAPETANCPKCDPYVTSLVADPMASSYVPVLATHGYTGNGALVYDKPQKAGKAFWETEWSQENRNGDTPDPTMTSAIDMAQHIHNFMVITGVNSWNWWAIYHTADGLNDPQRMNPALIQPDQTLGAPYMFKRGYAFGNWSKFVRPGFARIGATDQPVPGILIEAYRDSTHLAIIAVNTNSTTVNEKFHLAGSTFGTVTPWITSADDSLAAKSTFTATDQFSFDLPGTSVVTFVNWDATTETPGQIKIELDGGNESASGGPSGDAALFASSCSANAAGITLIDDGSAATGTSVSFSPTFNPPACGMVGSWTSFATNSGTITPSPFTFSPLPAGIPAEAGVMTAATTVGDASAGADGAIEAGTAGPRAACMSGATGVSQYSTSGIGVDLVQVSSSSPATLDASSHTGIRFWAWGGSEIASQSIYVVLRDINQTAGFGPAGTPTATGTLCNSGSSGPTACGGDRVSETITPGWQLVSIPFTSFVPISGYSSGNGESTVDPSTLTRFELQVQESAAAADAGVPYDLCIYGLSFY